MKKIILYSTHCIMCDAIETILKENNFEFEVISDHNLVMEVAEKNNIDKVPFADIDGEIFNTEMLRNYIKKEMGNK